jgi:glycosyltransferase involved in cell wall biosynthesis
MKLACVIHRFGADIAGGSEGHCRAIAHQLAAAHDVTVLTTCARDHVTWQNTYPEGRSRDGALQVVRFPVARQRSLHRFAELSEVVLSGRGSADDEAQWFRENGPDTPALLDHLDRHGQEYDRVLFWSFRYAPTFFGLPLVKSRSVLVPTAEEDPVIRLDTLEDFFALPGGYVFLTPEEAELVERRAGRRLVPSTVIGTGLEPAGPKPSRAALTAAGISPPFVLYLGRVDPNKGCGTLLRYFARREAEAPHAAVPLVMAGPVNMPIEAHPSVRVLGFVDPPLREALLAHASVLVVPSPYESLSLVLLEAWNTGVPALVNAGCRVLKGQLLRAGGGLYYRNFDEFASALDYLLAHQDEAAALGRQGLSYVEHEYRWPTVVSRLETLLSSPELSGR